MKRTRRHKKDQRQRAFQRGLRAGLYGRAQNSCPYHALNKRASWLTGWREGIDHHLHGCLGDIRKAG